MYKVLSIVQLVLNAIYAISCKILRVKSRAVLSITWDSTSSCSENTHPASMTWEESGRVEGVPVAGISDEQVRIGTWSVKSYPCDGKGGQLVKKAQWLSCVSQLGKHRTLGECTVQVSPGSVRKVPGRSAWRHTGPSCSQVQGSVCSFLLYWQDFLSLPVRWQLGVFPFVPLRLIRAFTMPVYEVTRWAGALCVSCFLQCPWQWGCFLAATCH